MEAPMDSTPEALEDERVRKTIARMERQEKAVKAVALRRGGATYEQIAQALDVSPTTAYRYVARALKTAQTETADELRKLHLDRYRAMLLIEWPKVQDNEHPDHYRAMDRVNQIMAKIESLEGIEAPKRIEVHQTGVLTIGGAEQDYIERLKSMAGVSPVPQHAIESTSDIDTFDDEDDESIVEAELIDEPDD